MTLWGPQQLELDLMNTGNFQKNERCAEFISRFLHPNWISPGKLENSKNYNEALKKVGKERKRGNGCN